MRLATIDTRLFIHRIAEHWAEGSEAPPTPEGTRWRGSWAGMCARKVAYQAAKAERTDPPSLADYWRMGLGSVVHELLKPAIDHWLAEDDSVTIEEEVDCDLGEHGAGHCDLVLYSKERDEKVVLELKTINGFGYKMAVERGEGPRHSHILQGALYATALDADLLIIGYLSMENISPSRARSQGLDDIGRFASEWHFTPDEFRPMAELEGDRLAAITDLIAEGGNPKDVPRRFSHTDPDIPFPAEIRDSAAGVWELVNDGYVTNTGKAWQCNYCDYQTRCVNDSQG